LNRAAEQFLNVEEKKSRGRFLQEYVRHPELQAFVRRAIQGDVPLEGDIVLLGDEDRFFQVRGSPLRDARERKIGVLVVLNEVTRLYKLERVRRDFVANVSHELKTPVTAIRGFAETLLEEGTRKPEEIRRFLGIILRQATRLNTLVDDLLSLAQLERREEEAAVVPAPEPVRPVLEAAVQSCAAQAGERGVRVEIRCPEEAEARLDPELFERAVANLVDNAIKYSESGTTVEVECEPTEENVLVRVRDRGCGIPREHLPRLFERFYRVDKARSRAVGGTGLGLAIVKHIVLAHRGAVSVESEPGRGSVFTLTLPRALQAPGNAPGKDGGLTQI
ncbi:MAG: ATP-binding protein, partial [Planctomycetota bacterium]